MRNMRNITAKPLYCIGFGRNQPFATSKQHAQHAHNIALILPFHHEANTSI